ncbi:hypothetical protein TNCV_2419091 [Trichonephila clavipes]|nr:hypothetical protein TNCV_2419091 [Trichonephila clavipes]
MGKPLSTALQKEHLVPTESSRKLGLGSSFSFQHDNDPKHTAEIMKLRLLYTVPNQLHKPLQLLDLNPIKYLWDLLDCRIRHHNISIKFISEAASSSASLIQPSDFDKPAALAASWKVEYLVPMIVLTNLSVRAIVAIIVCESLQNVLLATLHEAKQMVANSACTTDVKSGLPTWRVMLNVGIVAMCVINKTRTHNSSSIDVMAQGRTRPFTGQLQCTTTSQLVLRKQCIQHFFSGQTEEDLSDLLCPPPHNQYYPMLTLEVMRSLIDWPQRVMRIKRLLALRSSRTVP